MRADILTNDVTLTITTVLFISALVFIGIYAIILAKQNKFNKIFLLATVAIILIYLYRQIFLVLLNADPYLLNVNANIINNNFLKSVFCCITTIIYIGIQLKDYKTSKTKTINDTILPLGGMLFFFLIG